MEHQPVISASDLGHQHEVRSLLAQATPERRAIGEKLLEKKWFLQSDSEIQKQLLTLPASGRENHDGFLEDLARRPEEIANIKVERMIDLPHGSFALVPKFEVSRLDNPSMRYTYEYVSWRTGPLSGAKGIVFVEKDGQTTHFIALHGDKFAPGKKVWDTVGGFAELGLDGVHTLDERTVKEIQEELGVPDLKVTRKIELGRVNTDASMTNNEPHIFAAFIDGSDAAKIGSQSVNQDVYELNTGAVVIPMEQLSNIVMTNSDSLFLSSIARLWAKGLIAPPLSYGHPSVGFSVN